MIQTEDGLNRTRKALSHVENALRDLTTRKHEYHPKTFALIVEPIIDDIRNLRSQIDGYIDLATAEAAVAAYAADEGGTTPQPPAAVGVPSGPLTPPSAPATRTSG
jgi:hypothetical protein